MLGNEKYEKKCVKIYMKVEEEDENLIMILSFIR